MMVLGRDRARVPTKEADDQARARAVEAEDNFCSRLRVHMGVWSHLNRRSTRMLQQNLGNRTWDVSATVSPRPGVPVVVWTGAVASYP